MKKIKYFFLILFLIIAIITSIVFANLYPNSQSFEKKRAKILNSLHSSIDEAVAQGKYKCCIDPPCTMCYLGEWIWKDGTCHCDEMIAKGEWDKVCPQCKKGIENGQCKSSSNNKCEIQTK